MEGKLEFGSSDVSLWKQALSSYPTRLQAVKKAEIVELDSFYTKQLPTLLHQRDPNPHITKSELSKLMQWKLTRGKWRPRLMSFVSSLDEEQVKYASEKAFGSLPDLSEAVSALTTLKGVGPATASAILASYAPHIAPFMSDEAMLAALGNAKEYTLKQYLSFAEKLQAKAKELSIGGVVFTPSDVERALWATEISLKIPASTVKNSSPERKKKRQRKSQ
ncbi:hypothetical protein AMTRI_Chr12g272380 [Amborella trichopoda]|uniref:HhH-GPD domain-containing protein n=1 Tax=Amborella trichopoda TaxID=13333 RepID=U5CYX7_AMBTC|nr:uncharacterized protein LOC18446882 [Amborella trichopoda]ERN18516.1 hypothetical protein AMTR_s00065p00045180 [Amborella trichopoda]|eukprot:XP_006857049.1 uncharacterized protein LOC18446882 [Amborella trichopoda]